MVFKQNSKSLNMAHSTERHQEEVLDIIEKSSENQHLENIIRNIPFDDVQSFLTVYVTNQSSPEMMMKLYYAAKSMLDIRDCVQHVVTFLGYREMCSLSAVNQTFDRLAKDQSRQSMIRATCWLILRFSFFCMANGAILLPMYCKLNIICII